MNVTFDNSELKLSDLTYLHKVVAVPIMKYK